MRAAEAFAALSLPGAVNVPDRDLFGKEWTRRPRAAAREEGRRRRDEAEARKACLLLHELGYENLAVLDGGFPNFESTILEPVASAAPAGRWDGDVLRFREDARSEILRLTEAARPRARRNRRWKRRSRAAAEAAGRKTP